ncbi:unnamed protein product [Bathycoccus prasinos]
MRAGASCVSLLASSSSSSSSSTTKRFERRRLLGDSPVFKRKSKSNDDDDDKTIDEENPGRTRFENEEQKLWTSYSGASSSLKKELLSIIASSRKANTNETRAKKREILNKVLELEKEASAKLDLEGDIQGRWSLVYSTDDDENKAMFMLDDANDKVVKEILDSLYKFFFAFAAPLAGGFSSSETAKRKERGGELFKSIRNEQIVDLTNESVENFVDLEILGRETRVVVRGEIKPLDKNQRKVQVTFTDWSFDNLVTLPLPRPTGGLENTYCDETMRISRGSRGGVFITTRIRGGGGQESGKKGSP